jgi:signal transduction histidine kinase
MNIRVRLTILFSFIVASILLLFSISIYILSADYRKEEFYSRLESRAITTARLLVSVDEVDIALLKIIDNNSIHSLFREQVVVLDSKNQVVYSNMDSVWYFPDLQMVQQIRDKGKKSFSDGEHEHVGITYPAKSENYVIIASAYDRYGKSKLRNLQMVLITGLLVGLGIIVMAGIVFTHQTLSPIAKMNAEISMITAGNLEKRIDEGNGKDELATLAHNFNQMLERLEAAFESQQQFVSNASHELRNPLAAMSSQLQAVLEKERDKERYQVTLRSLEEDTRRLIKLINGLLGLAQSDVERQKGFFQLVRLDEVLFSAQQELKYNFPNAQFWVEFGDLLEEESKLIVKGDPSLLQTVFFNILENSCKFSPEQRVRIRLEFDSTYTTVFIEDEGIGIPEEDLFKVFQPFYRAKNATLLNKGHGIGLSLCQKIIQLHQGELVVSSVEGIGTTLMVRLPNIQPG